MDDSSKKLAHAFLDGDIHASWMIVQQHVNEGMNSYYIYEQLLTPAMHYIGELWEKNEITVADEHIATGVCDFILSRYSFQFVQQNKAEKQKRAIFFCLEGEEHYLGIKMVSALFQEEGWDVRFLGPNLPLEYMLYTVQNFKPEVVGISLSLSTQLPQLKDYLHVLEEQKESLTILVGSRIGPSIDTNFILSKSVQFIYSLQEIRMWFEKETLQTNEEEEVIWI
ncbi:cobalamin-dependent protein [Alkalihalobacillus sp. MEB130]|uniref:cobalamin B12-binding domain-containing protein n=1 Tax=Alkalihalobacillus sp. MEB130 TaxID=2976704 RepID=UPI0028DF4B2A|nr:cobalamin-dependent protein [Alkalihalobacillus sp. MEB130]MDT8859579.1 cobalamin-dependent protein [Alkalihalobacillus sp. MEB130]